MADKDGIRQGRMVAALLAGMLAGTMIVGPAGAHVTGRVSHLINKHLAKAFYTKAQAEGRFLNRAEAEGRFLNHAEAGAAFLSPAEGDALYQRVGCGNDPNHVMVKVGPVCIDRYEASVWSSPTGGVQYGVTKDDYPCNDNGQDCVGKIYARSVPGVPPSTYITWFQAQQALANSGKRLPTNAEWQMAVAGTPDSTACNVSTREIAKTGASAACISSWGLNDMVGNVAEWVADWDEHAEVCTAWSAGYGTDFSCFGDSSPDGLPGAVFRGGEADDGATAGPFAGDAFGRPSDLGQLYGFRGAR